MNTRDVTSELDDKFQRNDMIWYDNPPASEASKGVYWNQA